MTVLFRKLYIVFTDSGLVFKFVSTFLFITFKCTILLTDKEKTGKKRSRSSELFKGTK